METYRINWDEKGETTLNLYESLFIVSGETPYSRWNSWCKQITAVNSDEKGWRLIGSFIEWGDQRINRSPKMYLVASTNQRQNRFATLFRIVILNTDGMFECTDLFIDKHGWSIAWRNQIQAALSSLR